MAIKNMSKNFQDKITFRGPFKAGANYAEGDMFTKGGAVFLVVKNKKPKIVSVFINAAWL